MRHGLGRRVLLVGLQNVLGTLVGYLGLWSIIRFLGVSSWGVIGFATGFHSLFSFLLILPVDSAMIKLINEGEEESRVFSGALFIKAVASVIFSASILLAIFTWTKILNRGFETPYHERVLILLIPYSVLASIIITYRSYLDAKLRTASSTFPAIVESIFRNIMFFALAYFLFKFGSPGIWTSQLIAIVMSVSYILYLTIYLTMFDFPKLSLPDREILKKLWSFSRPLVISTIIDRIVSLDRIILQYFYMAFEVGIYFSFYRMVSVMQVYGKSLIFVIFPAMTKSSFDKRDLLVRSSKYTIFVFSAVPAIVLPLSWAISNLFSRTLALYSDVLKILVLWGILTVSVIPYRIFLMNFAEGRRSIMWASGAATATNIVLDLILIPSRIGEVRLPGLGVLGAAIGTLAAAVVYNLIIRLEAVKKGVPGIMGSELRAILAVLATVALALLIQQFYYPIRAYAVAAFALLYASAYVLFSLLVDLVDLEDLRYLLRVASPTGMISYVREEIWGD